MQSYGKRTQRGPRDNVDYFFKLRYFEDRQDQGRNEYMYANVRLMKHPTRNDAAKAEIPKVVQFKIAAAGLGFPAVSSR